MGLGQHLVNAAIAQLEQRFPDQGGIAAAMITEDGRMLTGVSFQPEWGGGGLCAETGPICEAAKLNVRITASVCVSRLSGTSPIVILTPCGICQERLFHWGGAVEIAVPDLDRAGGWQSRTLDQIQPYYWVNVYSRTSS
jgi:cytidine deaminase